ncbi:MAG: DEAD/DEAH box helicase family protein [Chloroflexi bacterium]|nr:DEAD/DEAH box helicase family protein [Chloroflexota bacterium]
MPRKQSSLPSDQPSLAHIPPPEMKGPRPDTPKPDAVKPQARASELFIVDNRDEHWKGAAYLREWCEIARAFDIATGYFEIGALLALDGHWQKLEQIRILMGDEVSKRTQDAFRRAVHQIEATLDASLESEKDRDDFLRGVPAIVAALQNGKIVCKVYRERKFHAKAYITHGRFEVMGSTALVGSSNFTRPGLTENIELNVRLRSEVELLQQWYERYWREAVEVTPEILQVIERHVREYSPFEVYVKALAEYFAGHELTPEEWEQNSDMYRTLDHYQKEGYHALLKRGAQYRGALLADSVGLGKTFIGMMLIARLLREGRKVVLLVPKAANHPVWKAKLERFLPDSLDSWSGLRIYNHTDLLRGGDYVAKINSIARNADVILIDEAHHFRTRAAKTYKKLFELAEGKTLYLLTATPVNNSLLDLQHLIELFTHRDSAYFKDAPLGIHSLPGHFRRLESAVKKLVGETDGVVEITTDEAERLLKQDPLFQALVVQRSRAYARKSSQERGGIPVVFPERKPPQVAGYSLRRTYGPLLNQVDRAFEQNKSLLALAMYNPLAYSRKKLESAEERWVANRQNQVVGLIRVQLLKRFESSARAFQATCQDLLLRLLAFARANSKTDAEEERLEEWQANHIALLDAIHAQHAAQDEEQEEDILPSEFLENAEELSRTEYKIQEILDDTFNDLNQLAGFLNDLQDFDAARDDKLQTLIAMLRTHPLLSKYKVLIFTEYMATARYLAHELEKAGIGPLDQVDSSSHRDRGEIITNFSPYYNESSSAELAAQNRPETRVLISTDVLSEGLNLQDATLLINYDLHWNPVRLMQRIGRVDRRLDPATEARMKHDHPEYKNVRGVVHYWNFLPPGELDELLRLYQRVAHKMLRISKVFGIEGKKLLTPQDDYDALKEFNEAYEGVPSREESLRLYYRELLTAHPGLDERVNHFPLRVFSAKAHPEGKQAVFFCYHLPAKNAETNEWDGETGRTQWYLLDVQSEKISEDAMEIDKLIRSTPDTPRRRVLHDETLTALRKRVEAHIKATYLKSVQAPAGVKPILKAWMELN